MSKSKKKSHGFLARYVKKGFNYDRAKDIAQGKQTPKELKR